MRTGSKFAFGQFKSHLIFRIIIDLIDCLINDLLRDALYPQLAGDSSLG